MYQPLIDTRRRQSNTRTKYIGKVFTSLLQAIIVVGEFVSSSNSLWLPLFAILIAMLQVFLAYITQDTPSLIFSGLYVLLNVFEICVGYNPRNLILDFSEFGVQIFNLWFIRWCYRKQFCIYWDHNLPVLLDVFPNDLARMPIHNVQEFYPQAWNSAIGFLFYHEANVLIQEVAGFKYFPTRVKNVGEEEMNDFFYYSTHTRQWTNQSLQRIHNIMNTELTVCLYFFS